MRILGGFCIVLFATGGLFAQVRGAYSNPRPITNPFGSVVFPGSSSSQPGVQRTFGSVVFPGSGTPQFRAANPLVPGVPVQVGRPFPNPGVPGFIGSGGINAGRASRRQQTTFVYAYPVFVGGGGGYGNGYYDAPPPPEMMGPPPAAQPNVTVVMPPQAQPMVSRDGQYAMESQQGTISAYQPPQQEEAPPEPTRYLLAFKDHTVYSALAYWVDGDTLHYFTSGNTHNQVSLSLVDRDLTQRLNKESGVELKLPAPKQ